MWTWNLSVGNPGPDAECRRQCDGPFAVVFTQSCKNIEQCCKPSKLARPSTFTRDNQPPTSARRRCFRCTQGDSRRRSRRSNVRVKAWANVRRWPDRARHDQHKAQPEACSVDIVVPGSGCISNLAGQRRDALSGDWRAQVRHLSSAGV